MTQTKDQKKHINALMPEELKQLLDTVSKHFPKHYTLFLLLARTGVRIGEVLALQWGDIDFNSDFIRVERSYKRGIVEKPKYDRLGKMFTARFFISFQKFGQD